MSKPHLEGPPPALEIASSLAWAYLQIKFVLPKDSEFRLRCV